VSLSTLPVKRDPLIAMEIAIESVFFCPYDVENEPHNKRNIATQTCFMTNSF
jgi:hypothetical protein